MNGQRPPREESADALLTRLGRLTAVARERVEVQQARVELAEALQREMLPARLPQVPGLRAAARYAPARDGLDIGGDWYDGFELGDGTLGFSIGDVQGHDVEAAAFMGQVRMALRAVASTVSDPGEILGRVNDLLVSVDGPLFATCSFLRFDPATNELYSARAGHVGAVWAATGGRGGVAEDVGGLPLGIISGERYPVTRRRWTRPGAYVLLTDGVVEGPSFSIEEGLARVTQLVTAGVGLDPGSLADRVMRVAGRTGHLDDAAVLVRCHEGPAPGGGRP